MDQDDQVETLSEEECTRLLSTVPVGRVVYTEHALPAVLPVAFRLTPDGRLVLALRAGSVVPRALDGTVAAFQADLLDPAARTGWSVLVHGRASLVRDPAERDTLLADGLVPWVPGQAPPMYVVIVPELVSGRRLCAEPAQGAAPG